MATGDVTIGVTTVVQCANSVWVKRSQRFTERVMAKREQYFSWTDDEAELLLNITLEYKTEKSLDNIDWESIRNKYSDIYERLIAHLTSVAEGETTAFDKDYSHRPDEITKAIVTSKLKGIRGKYRQAVDSGRRSGHGRVVLLYFTLCQEIWGGSPATEKIKSGLESGDLENSAEDGKEEQVDVEVQIEVNTEESDVPTQQVEVNTEEADVPTQQVEVNTEEADVPTQQDTGRKIANVSVKLPEGNVAQEKKSAKRKAVSTQQKSEASSSSAIPGPSRLTSSKGNTSQETAKMRKLLDEKLSTYKQKNLGKRLPAADSAENMEFRKKMMQQLEDSDEKFHESMQQMSSNLDKLSGAILSGFTLLKQTLPQSQGVPQHSTYQSFHAGAPLYPSAGYQFNSRYPVSVMNYTTYLGNKHNINNRLDQIRKEQ